MPRALPAIQTYSVSVSGDNVRRHWQLPISKHLALALDTDTAAARADTDADTVADTVTGQAVRQAQLQIQQAAADTITQLDQLKL